jgi:hypothetical protein
VQWNVYWLALTMLDVRVSDGIMHLSFKRGESERIKEGRWLTDLTQESQDQLHSSIDQCRLVECWITSGL